MSALRSVRLRHHRKMVPAFGTARYAESTLRLGYNLTQRCVSIETRALRNPLPSARVAWAGYIAPATLVATVIPEASTRAEVVAAMLHHGPGGQRQLFLPQ
jgi:hypothetical protein